MYVFKNFFFIIVLYCSFVGVGLFAFVLSIVFGVELSIVILFCSQVRAWLSVVALNCSVLGVWLKLLS